MKNLFILFTLTLSLNIACNKKEVEESTKLKAGNEDELRILNFRDKMTNSNSSNDLSTRTSVSISDLVEETEATFNLIYVNSKDYQAWEEKSQSFQVNITNGFVSIAESRNFYNNALNFIANHYACIQSNTKDPQVYDLEFVINSQGNIATINVQSIVGTQFGNMSKSKSFGSGEDWHAYINRCVPNPNDYNKDAATEISRLINFNRRSGILYAFRNIEYHDTKIGDYGWGALNPNDITLNDGIKDYLHWHFTCPNLNKPCGSFNLQDLYCIESDEMNWYMTNVNNYITSIEQLKNKRFYFCDLIGDLLPCQSCNHQLWRKGFQIGTRYIKTVPSEPLPIVTCVQ